MNRSASAPHTSFASFADFYPYYLSEHRNRMCRRLHFIGTVLVLCTVAAVLATANAYASPFFNIIGYTARLGPLTDDEARELVASSPLPFAGDDVDWMLAESRHWPVVLQALCAELLATLENGQRDDGWRDRALEQAAPFAAGLPGFGAADE